ncbi:MAG: bifunctional (p)ppGpp synthetase/guanosine-3',5'-bis(diphosphate) 3'-pyrophosphohydrolase [Alphaproteobacteria bacterium]|nr:bifunctional (p)ppGpp synthetase/guanosine-3',5'-bis(diphosphate) 3'-pyrophosphohydrolase [Alphaproteobacteria bacterium]
MGLDAMGQTAPVAPAARKKTDDGKPRSRGFLRQYELVDRVKVYQPDADEEALNKAYVFATLKHGQQLRHSGDPYYAHPVAVAGLLTELRMDQATIIAGLLHDTVEDTEATVEEIRALFGDEVGDLVDGVTKLPRLDGEGPRQQQAENFQKFILATTRDIRVLLVKLADRLHNMRTIEFMPKPESRQRIARETLDIYAPLARRVGLSIFAGELEDHAFRVVNPEAYEAIVVRLDEILSDDHANLSRIQSDIETVMFARGVRGELRGRMKRPYSIWRKLESKSISFKDLGDVFAYRLIVGSVEECYRALGAAHQQWAALSERFKDYISVPKPNGYRSIHTTFLGPGNRRVELQIRTRDMDAIADRGVAAHWTYKNAEYGFDAEAARAEGLDAEAELTAFADMLAHGAEPEEFLEHAKLQMYRDSVFVFTPKGKLVKLPAGSTPLDFAYAVHSEIGDHTVGARINNVERPLRTALENGDVVEIIRGSKAAVHANWEGLAVTGRARSAIRRLTRAAERGEFIAIGNRLIEHALRRIGLEPSEVNKPEMAERAGHEKMEALSESVGRGRMTTAELMATAFPGIDDPARQTAPGADGEAAPSLVAGDDLTPGVTLHLAECCSPLPGDRIVGVLIPERGIEVHVIDCARLADFEGQADRWIDLRWKARTDKANEVLAVGRIVVTTANRRGALALLCKTVSEAQGNIINVKTLKRSTDFFDFEFDIEVEDSRRLTQIVAAMRALSVVDRAERIRG